MGLIGVLSALSRCPSHGGDTTRIVNDKEQDPYRDWRPDFNVETYLTW